MRIEEQVQCCTFQQQCMEISQHCTQDPQLKRVPPPSMVNISTASSMGPIISLTQCGMVSSISDSGDITPSV